MSRQHNDAIVWIYNVKCCVHAHKRRNTLSQLKFVLVYRLGWPIITLRTSADISLLQIQNCEVYANVDECRSPGARVQVSGGRGPMARALYVYASDPRCALATPSCN